MTVCLVIHKHDNEQPRTNSVENIIIVDEVAEQRKRGSKTIYKRGCSTTAMLWNHLTVKSLEVNIPIQ